MTAIAGKLFGFTGSTQKKPTEGRDLAPALQAAARHFEMISRSAISQERNSQ